MCTHNPLSFNQQLKPMCMLLLAINFYRNALLFSCRLTWSCTTYGLISYTCIRIHIHTHTYTHTYIHTYSLSYNCTCTHMYIHTYTHTLSLARLTWSQSPLSHFPPFAPPVSPAGMKTCIR